MLSRPDTAVRQSAGRTRDPQGTPGRTTRNTARSRRWLQGLIRRLTVLNRRITGRWLVSTPSAAPVSMGKKERRLSEELLAAGFTNVRRYQLGIPVSRALGGSTQIEPEAVVYFHGQEAFTRRRD